ncbi:MAG: hypothetical protein AAB393_06615 [Bacteroidota bacterium]
MSQSPIPIVRVTASVLREMFNSGHYWERTQDRGDLTAIVERSRHPALPAAQEPFCTRSQQVSYYDAHGHEVARVHQYKRPDGAIGASGRPDPKRLFHEGTLYRIEKQA